MCNRPALLVASSMLWILLGAASCGGGSTAISPPGGDGVQLYGQLTLDDTIRGTSANAGLAGAAITAINASDGQVQGSVITATDGSFHFNDLDNGTVVLRIEFNSNYDIDGDGIPDTLDLMQELDLSSAVEVNYTGNLMLTDTNGDNRPDSITVERQLAIDGDLRSDVDLRVIKPQLQKLLIDTDDDGETEDEPPQPDIDSNGLPDDAFGHMNSLHGGVLRGPIEAIDEDSLTVEGVEFGITDGTRWTDKGNRQADPAMFVAGLNVLIKGMWNGTDWFALEVKTTGPRIEPPDDDDDDEEEGGQLLSQFVAHFDSMGDMTFIAGGVSFAFTEDTQWADSLGAVDPASLMNYDLLKVEAIFEEDTFTVTEVRLLEADDNSGLLMAQFIGRIDVISETALTVGGLEFDAGEAEWYFLDGTDALFSDFLAGERVLVQAEYDGTAWAAEEVRPLESDTGGLFMTQFVGHLEDLTDPWISVGGIPVHFTTDTEWEIAGEEVDPTGFVVGDIVQAIVMQMGTDWHATEVRLLETDPDSGLFMAQYFGDLSALEDTSLSLGTQGFGIGTATAFYSAIGVLGSASFFAIGDDVLVDAGFDGTSWLATMVKPLEFAPADDDDEDDEDEDDSETELVGIIEAMGDGSVRVSGHDFMTDADTQWLIGSEVSDSSMFAIGDKVKIEAVAVGDAWLATEVRLMQDDDEDDDDDDPALASFKGELSAYSETELMVDDTTIMLDADTEFIGAGGAVVDPASFEVGDKVEVLARMEGDVWLALHVVMLGNGGHGGGGGGNSDEHRLSRFRGSVDSFTNTDLIVDGMSFMLDEETDFIGAGGLGDLSLLSVGAEVTVLARKSGADWTAVRIVVMGLGGMGM